MRRESDPYPFWLRVWHWSNLLLFVTLLITGVSMHYAKPGPPSVKFRADVLIHNTAGILLTLFYGLFLYGNLRLGNGRYYRFVAGDFAPGLIRQARYYLWGIFVGSPHPYPETGERKFNPLQKLSYVVVMYLPFPILIVTGWALLFPDRLPKELFGAPGIAPWALAHTYLGVLLALFMVGHAYLGTTGTTPGELFRLMWSGGTERQGPPPTLRGSDPGDGRPPGGRESPASMSKEHP